MLTPGFHASWNDRPLRKGRQQWKFVILNQCIHKYNFLQLSSNLRKKYIFFFFSCYFFHYLVNSWHHVSFCPQQINENVRMCKNVLIGGKNLPLTKNWPDVFPMVLWSVETSSVINILTLSSKVEKKKSGPGERETSTNILNSQPILPAKNTFFFTYRHLKKNYLFSFRVTSLSDIVYFTSPCLILSSVNPQSMPKSS